MEAVTLAFKRLDAELDLAGDAVADRVCVDDWTVKDVLAVRAWWTEKVVEWIEAGRRGETPQTPAVGYTWRETPRLNQDVVEESRSLSLADVRDRLTTGCARVIETIDDLDDRELLTPGVFQWAGKWPVARWISINTARQYTTARTYIRRVRRGSPAGSESGGRAS